MSTQTLKKDYNERIVPALEKEFNYSTVMQVPRLKKIVINMGLGEATQDKKIIETAINEAHCHHRPESSSHSFTQGYL